MLDRLTGVSDEDALLIPSGAPSNVPNPRKRLEDLDDFDLRTDFDPRTRPSEGALRLRALKEAALTAPTKGRVIASGSEDRAGALATSEGVELSYEKALRLHARRQIPAVREPNIPSPALTDALQTEQAHGVGLTKQGQLNKTPATKPLAAKLLTAKSLPAKPLQNGSARDRARLGTTAKVAAPMPAASARKPVLKAVTSKARGSAVTQASAATAKSARPYSKSKMHPNAHPEPSASKLVSASKLTAARPTRSSHGSKREATKKQASSQPSGKVQTQRNSETQRTRSTGHRSPVARVAEPARSRTHLPAKSFLNKTQKPSSRQTVPAKAEQQRQVTNHFNSTDSTEQQIQRLIERLNAMDRNATDRNATDRAATDREATNWATAARYAADRNAPLERSRPLPVEPEPLETEPLELRSATISVRLNEEEVAALRLRAAESGISVSAYMRSCVLEADHLREQVKQTLSTMRAATLLDAVPDAQETGSMGKPSRRSWWRRLRIFAGNLLMPSSTLREVA